MGNQHDNESELADIKATIEIYNNHAALIGKIAIEWNKLHEFYGLRFANIMTPKNLLLGLDVWQSVQNDRTKRRMLSAAIIHTRNQVTDRYLEDANWCLGKTNSLEDSRDTAIHSPIHMDFENVGVSVFPSDFFGHLRAKRLSNKDIKLELESYFTNIRAMVSFWLELHEFMHEPKTSPTWPERPSLPKPAHPIPGQG